MAASIVQDVLFIGVVGSALFCLANGMNMLHQKHSELWFNQPEILLGIGLIFFALLNFALLSFREQAPSKLIAVPCLIFLFLSLSFFMFRSLLLFVRNFS
jgi:hypothetical protein